MRGILADVNFGGQLDRIFHALRDTDWYDYWIDCDVVVETFSALGLDPKANDRLVWERCQSEGLLLLTGNRNADGPNSLEMAIRNGPSDALPVLTVSDNGRIISDGAYALAAALTLLEVVTDTIRRPETVLGAGRIYLPKNPVRK